MNYRKRFQQADLSGKTALVTGARVKIGTYSMVMYNRNERVQLIVLYCVGHQCALKLLVAGATVIATTRFPTDASHRFAQHPEYHLFKSRLHIVGLDLRLVSNL